MVIKIIYLVYKKKTLSEIIFQSIHPVVNHQPFFLSIKVKKAGTQFVDMRSAIWTSSLFPGFMFNSSRRRRLDSKSKWLNGNERSARHVTYTRRRVDKNKIYDFQEKFSKF